MVTKNSFSLLTDECGSTIQDIPTKIFENVTTNTARENRNILLVEDSLVNFMDMAFFSRDGRKRQRNFGGAGM